MMRNVAMGAVIGFAVMVIVLSISGSSAPDPAPALAPSGAAAVAEIDAGLVALPIPPKIKGPSFNIDRPLREALFRKRAGDVGAPAAGAAPDAGP